MFGRRWTGPEPRGNRLFERGDLKYVILDLLKERPRHGYDVIRSLEERFSGFYTPSPGAVYPSLEMLADMGLVAASEHDGKRTYSITEEGERFLAEHGQVVNDIRNRMGGWWSPAVREELREMKRELRDLTGLFDHRSRRLFAEPDRLARIRQVVAQARKDIEAILTETGSS